MGNGQPGADRVPGDSGHGRKHFATVHRYACLIITEAKTETKDKWRTERADVRERRRMRNLIQTGKLSNPTRFAVR